MVAELVVMALVAELEAAPLDLDTDARHGRHGDRAADGPRGAWAVADTRVLGETASGRTCAVLTRRVFALRAGNRVATEFTRTN